VRPPARASTVRANTVRANTVRANTVRANTVRAHAAARADDPGAGPRIAGRYSQPFVPSGRTTFRLSRIALRSFWRAGSSSSFTIASNCAGSGRTNW